MTHLFLAGFVGTLTELNAKIREAGRGHASVNDAEILKHIKSLLAELTIVHDQPGVYYSKKGTLRVRVLRGAFETNRRRH